MATIKPIAHQLTMTDQERAVLQLSIQDVIKTDHWVLPGEVYIWEKPAKAAMLLKLYSSIKEFTSIEITKYQAELLVECMEQMKRVVCHSKEDRAAWHGNDLMNILKKAAK